jgi:HAD superfamily hydrolase (TIGR01509 family)
MRNAFEAVLFDMDGVTVDTAGAWRTLEENEILPAATEPTVDIATIRALSVDDTYDKLRDLEEVDLRVDRNGLWELYDEHAQTVYGERATLFEGYHDLLDAIDAGGYSLGLVSASPRRWVQIVLDRFDLEARYNVIVTATDIDGPSKPDPTTYRVAARNLGVDPGRCLVVEDSPHGIESATGAGAYCLALRGDGNADLDLSQADETVDAEGLRDRLGALLDRDL